MVTERSTTATTATMNKSRSSSNDDHDSDDGDDVLCIPGTFLTKSKSSSQASSSQASFSSPAVSRLLVSNVSLSFWGGIDPRTGVVIDQGHPLMGHSVSNNNNNNSMNESSNASSSSSGTTTTTTMLCLPSGRGSCTASQVLLELLLNGLAPSSIVLRDADGLVTVGALIAEEIFGVADMDIVCVGTRGFQTLLDHTILVSNNNSNSKEKGDGKSVSSLVYRFGGIDRSTGSVILGKTAKAVQKELEIRSAYVQAQDEIKDDKNDEDENDENDDDGAAGHFDAIALTEEEKTRMSTSQNEAERMALRVIFRYARILMQSSQDDNDIDNNNNKNNNKRLHPMYIPVTNAHIDGCTYIGPGGLSFVQRLVQAGGKVVVPTTLNAVSADRRQWQALGVPQEYAQNSIALGDAYLRLDCRPSFTCAPYLLSSVTDSLSAAATATARTTTFSGADVVWGESNAVVYANSVLGAHTEKTADYLDICSALTGIIPRAGVYLVENRKPRIGLDATKLVVATTGALLDLDVLAPVLGHLCGTLSNGQVPILIGLENTWIADSIVKEHHLKSFCAAFGTTGTSPLIHIAGITPEALNAAVVQEWIQDCRRDAAMVPVTMQGLEQAFGQLDRDGDRVQKIDLIALGNPHLSISECEYLVQLVQEKTDSLLNITSNNNTPTMVTSTASSSPSFTPKHGSVTTAVTKKHDGVRLVACISRELFQQAQTAGHVQILQDFGMEFISDTCWCMLLDPPLIPPPRIVGEPTATLTNSGKYAHYAPGLTNRPVRFASTANCIEAAISGHYHPSQPTRASAEATNPLGSNNNTSMPSWLAARRRQHNTSTTMQKRSLTTTTTFACARKVVLCALRVLVR
jgi:cis-L-3-hydroxyproline dehydratase